MADTAKPNAKPNQNAAVGTTGEEHGAAPLETGLEAGATGDRASNKGGANGKAHGRGGGATDPNATGSIQSASPLREAYPFVDHDFDVVVVGAGGAGLRATLGAAEGGPAHGLHLQGLPHPLAHRRRPGRRRGEPRATWGRTAGNGTCTTP